MLHRSLITEDAIGTRAFEVIAAYLRSHPAPGWLLQGGGIALAYLAQAEDLPTLASLIGDSDLDDSRASMVERLLEEKDPELDAKALTHLEDPSITPFILREMKRRRTFPDGFRARVEPLLHAELDETRKQAKQLLAKMARLGI